jgi:hypothetical protein
MVAGGGVFFDGEAIASEAKRRPGERNVVGGCFLSSPRERPDAEAPWQPCAATWYETPGR